MVQVQVKTALQEDYESKVPFQVPKPTVPIPWSTTNVWYPELCTGIDKSGGLNIFYDSRTYSSTSLQITNIYRDPITSQWIEEMTAPTPQTNDYTVALDTFRPRMKTARNPITGSLAVAYGFVTFGANQCYLLFLDLSARYPQWSSIIISSSLTTISDLDLGFDSGGNAFVVACLRTRSQAMGYKWVPSNPSTQSLTTIPELTGKEDSLVFLAQLKYGQYQDISVKPDLSPCEGYYLAGMGTGFEKNLSPYRATSGSHSSAGPSLVTAFGDAAFTGFDWVFLNDPSSAPLVFGVLVPFSNGGISKAVYFIVNNSYGNPSATDNVHQIFTDLPSGSNSGGPRVPIHVKGLAVQSQGSAMDTVKIPITVHAFAMFQLSDGSFELWHTSSVLGGVQEVQDGIFE